MGINTTNIYCVELDTWKDNWYKITEKKDDKERREVKKKARYK